VRSTIALRPLRSRSASSSGIGNSAPDASVALGVIQTPDALDVADEHQKHLGGRPGRL
jgi:hypothetical protein